MTEVLARERAVKRFEAQLAPIIGAAYGVAYHLTHNREEAEDLVQETSLQAFNSFHTFQEGTHFKAWFLKIMLNRFRNNYRKRKRAPETTALEDAPDLYLYMQTANAGLHSRSSDPAALVIGRMNEEQIKQTIASLPEEFQAVSVLYFVEELAYQEIAEIVGCPVGTVRSRLHRGRKILQKALWQVAEEQGILGDLLMEERV